MDTKQDLETTPNTSSVKPTTAAHHHAAPAKEMHQHCTYMQNRELSWLTFNERVLAQGADETVPLLERLTFISIFSSNLQEFFMVRVGSLTDLSLLKKAVLDSKTNMTPAEQLTAVYRRCHELYPLQESIFKKLRNKLAAKNIKNLHFSELDEAQTDFLKTHLRVNVIPFLS
ncbi:MAG: polyphosphate kinase 1, partial [Raoultibacter sp.]